MKIEIVSKPHTFRLLTTVECSIHKMVWFQIIANHKRLQQFVAGDINGRKNDDEKEQKRDNKNSTQTPRRIIYVDFSYVAI